MLIPFNKPLQSKNQFTNLLSLSSCFSGNGSFTLKSNLWLENNINCKKALLTHSCTAALEMSALLFEIGVGDEIIMPSYTFVSTANAFVLQKQTVSLSSQTVLRLTNDTFFGKTVVFVRHCQYSTSNFLMFGNICFCWNTPLEMINIRNLGVQGCQMTHNCNLHYSLELDFDF